MNWDLVLTVLGIGIALAISIAIIGAVITALQLAKFNAIRKKFVKDAPYLDMDKFSQDFFDSLTDGK